MQRERTFLQYLLYQRREREKELPNPIIELNQCGLYGVTPGLLLFLGHLVKKVASNVNDCTQKEQLIKTSKQESHIESDEELYKVFEYVYLFLFTLSVDKGCVRSAV